MSHRAARRGFVAAAVAVSAVLTAAHADAAQPTSSSSADRGQSDCRRSQLWSTLQLNLHASPASAAAFRLAEERSEILFRTVQANLHPTPGSPAAFRLADQRSQVAAATACMAHMPAAPGRTSWGGGSWCTR